MSENTTTERAPQEEPQAGATAAGIKPIIEPHFALEVAD